MRFSVIILGLICSTSQVLSFSKKGKIFNQTRQRLVNYLLDNRYNIKKFDINAHIYLAYNYTKYIYV